jgi:hypothetical protein
LLPIPALVPCEVRVPVPVPATIKKPAVVGPESSDDEPMFSDTGLTNPGVAADMATFLDSMQKTGEYIGIGAFVLFALRYRLRVHAWFQGVCQDLVNEGLILLGHVVESMNHWVVAIDFGEHDGPLVDLTREEGTDAEEHFFAFYLSLNRLVLRTIADGDCGLDGMCLMLGLPRTLANRKKYGANVVSSRGHTLGTER